MICENCGAKIGRRESYCPKCGMELFSSESKPLQKKFLRGEYREQEETPTEAYDLEEDISETTYQEDPYQYDEYEDRNYGEGDYKTKYEGNGDYNQRYKKNDYGQKRYHRRGYDLGDEDFESEETKSSIWGTVFLFLVIALLFGFVMGFMFFSTNI